MNDIDTREKLEVDIYESFDHARVNSSGSYLISHGGIPVSTIYGWLDRQAAITRRECSSIDWWAKVEALQAERDELLAMLDEKDELLGSATRNLDESLDDLKDIGEQLTDMESQRDELQAKLDAYDETHIALPVDADGDVLRIGDELKCLGESVLLNSLSWDGRRWYATETVVSSGWYPAHICRHVKPRTVEDVLRDLVDYFSPNAEWTQLDKNAVTEYADELRELMGGDAS